MIRTAKLLNAIQDRVQTWQIYSMYTEVIKAKQAAVKLFINETGVKIHKTGNNHYVLMVWHIDRHTDDEREDYYDPTH